MKEIAILNLTRFGDLIQTTPVMTGLRKRHPDARIHLIIKSRFRAAAELVPGIDAIQEIDGDHLANTLSDPDISFLDAFRDVRRIIEALASTHFDVVMNLTHSCSSAVLLDLLDPKESIGFIIDREGHRRVENPWLSHLSTVVRARRLMRFNLVDTYLGAARLAGCGERLSVRIPAAARELASRRLPDTSSLLGVQLGASQDAKTWPAERFASTLAAVATRSPQTRFVLVGVRAEAERAAALEAACPAGSVENLVGATAIDELAAVLERCTLLLTADTGTMHLAAAVGTPTCAIFVGLGNPYETAAYGEGHWTLRSRLPCAPCSHLVQCRHPICHDDFSPEWVAELVDRILRDDKPEAIAGLPRAELLRTRFDDNGLLELVPVHRRPAEPEDLLALAYQSVFFQSFSGTPARLESTWSRAQAFYGVEPGNWIRALPDDLLPAIEELRSLAGRGAACALELEHLETEASALRRAGETLEQIDQAIFGLARSHSLLAPLGLSLETAFESLPQRELAYLAATSAGIYRALQSRADHLDRLVRGKREGDEA